MDWYQNPMNNNWCMPCWDQVMGWYMMPPCCPTMPAFDHRCRPDNGAVAPIESPMMPGYDHRMPICPPMWPVCCFPMGHMYPCWPFMDQSTAGGMYPNPMNRCPDYPMA